MIPHIIFPDIANKGFMCTACLNATGMIMYIAVHDRLCGSGACPKGMNESLDI